MLLLLFELLAKTHHIGQTSTAKPQLGLQHYKECYQDHVDGTQDGEHVISKSRWAGSLKRISLCVFFSL